MNMPKVVPRHASGRGYCALRSAADNRLGRDSPVPEVAPGERCDYGTENTNMNLQSSKIEIRTIYLFITYSPIYLFSVIVISMHPSSPFVRTKTTKIGFLHENPDVSQ